MKLLVASSPHIFSKRNTAGIMYYVLLALSPLVAASIYFKGLDSAKLFLVCLAGAALAEFMAQKMSKQKVTLYDGSAAITGILLALVIPPDTPLWMAFIAGIFAIAAGKQAFGGLGGNIFNPALIGRLFLAGFSAVTPLFSRRLPQRTPSARRPLFLRKGLPVRCIQGC